MRANCITLEHYPGTSQSSQSLALDENEFKREQVHDIILSLLSWWDSKYYLGIHCSFFQDRTNLQWCFVLSCRNEINTYGTCLRFLQTKHVLWVPSGWWKALCTLLLSCIRSMLQEVHRQREDTLPKDTVHSWWHRLCHISHSLL